MRFIPAVAVLLFGAVACVPEPPPQQAPVISSFEALGAPHVDPALVPLRWAVSDPQSDSITCRLDGDGDGLWDHTFDPCPASASRNTPAVGAGTHTARIEVSDATYTTVATTTYTVESPSSTEPFNIVIRPSGPMDADVLAAFESAASRWESTIVGGVSDMAVTMNAGECGFNSAAFDGVVDDLVINVSMHVTAPAAALAWTCVIGPDNLTRTGYVEVDPDLLVNLRTLDILYEVALHELGHVLGFGALGQFYDFVSGGNTVDPRFTGPRALAENSALGRSGDIPIMTINGVMQPHWESAMLGPEIMASVPKGSALSRLTIASLADLGYVVDLDSADPYTPPLPAGTCVTFTETVVRCW